MTVVQISREKSKGQAGDPPIPLYIYAPRYAKIVKTKCKLLWRHL